MAETKHFKENSAVLRSAAHRMVRLLKQEQPQAIGYPCAFLRRLALSNLIHESGPVTGEPLRDTPGIG